MSGQPGLNVLGGAVQPVEVTFDLVSCAPFGLCRGGSKLVIAGPGFHVGPDTAARDAVPA